MVAGAGVDRGVFDILLAGGGVFDNLLAGGEGFAALLVLIVSNTYIAENKFIAKWSINRKKLVKKYYTSAQTGNRTRGQTMGMFDFTTKLSARKINKY